MSVVAEPRRRSRLKDLYHERTTYRFMDRKWRWLLLSGSLIVISLVSLGLRGLNLGIDFTGGTAWDVAVEGDTPSADEVRDALRAFDLADAKISFREDRTSGEERLLVQTEEVDPDRQGDVTSALDEYGRIDSVSEVGPTWGEQVTEQAVRALVIFFVVIALYLSFRLEWKMAVAALVAVVHDIVITAGVYSVTGFEVAPATVTVFLTILGFSLYDTIVVFDKIKENEAFLGAERGDTYSAMANRSLNQVLMRSLNTSVVALLPIASLLVVGSWMLGAVTLRDFGIALFVGILVGAYSSIFVAAPLLAWWKEREPRSRALRDRSAGIRRTSKVATGVRAGVDDAGALAAAEREATADLAPEGVGDADDGVAPPRSTAPPPMSADAVRPRPRRQRRRKRR